MADSIVDLVLERIERDKLEKKVADYVLEALEGSLDQFIDGESERESPERPAAESAAPAKAFLKRLSVTGFRGIGPQADMEVVPGPGLTLVVGANGTGKSSFAEGLEFLLTGENSRWKGRDREWQKGWRNLHSEEAPRLQAQFAVEGESGPAAVSRRWLPNATEPDEDSTEVAIAGECREGLTDLGWKSALDTHRPFLSYNQLSEVVENRPTARFDAMAAGLGLERLTDAREQLRRRRLDDERTLRAARDERDFLFGESESLDDERAHAVHAALANEPWDLNAIRLILEGVLDDDADRPLDLLQRMAAIEFPSAEEVKDCHDELHDAYAWLDAIEGSNAARAARLAQVMQAMLGVHEHDGDQTCPVCETGQIDGRWRATALERLESLMEEAEEANRATALLHDLIEKCEMLIREPPDWLADAGRVGIDASEVRRAWDWWERSLDDEPRLPDPDKLWQAVEPPSNQDHAIPVLYGTASSPTPSESTLTLSAQGLLEVAGRPIERGAGVRAALEPLREQAQAEFDRREDLWRPLSRRLRDWLQSGRRGQQAAKRVDAVQAAENWLAREEVDIRAERFRPIAQRARGNWSLLGRGSSVSLDDLELTGRANSRRLNLATSIDGQDGAALAVMSQGELNALSLSLFLARAVLPESPFGFLVIDDPVQAMDPVKVEGLACVLAEAARERQVIVFTHDQRLPDTVRRLRIEHRVLAVRRRERSVVTCTPEVEPVRQHLDNARAVLQTDDLDETTRRRVLPNFCRQAIEAACIEAVWRRRAEAGCDQAETERDVSRARTLNQKLILALLDDVEGRYEDMQEALFQRFGTRARNAVADCNRGAHELVEGDLNVLIHDAENLANWLRD